MMLGKSGRMWRSSLLLALLLALGACAPTMTSGSEVLGGGSATQPGRTEPTPSQPVVAGWVYPLFSPSEEARKEACDAGYAAGMAGSKEPNPGEATVSGANGDVTFQSSWGSVYNVCKAYAQKTEAKPEVIPVLDVLLYVFDPRLKSYSDPDALFQGISMVFYDAEGKELGRLPATLNKWSKGVLSIPQSNSKPSVYDGYFVLSTNYNSLPGNLRAAVTRAESFDVLISRGRGVERYSFNKAKFPTLR